MNVERQYRLKAFGIALLMAVVMILPVVIYSGGYMVFYGDYNAQIIPFHKECVRAVREGNFGWNWDTNLGASFLSSYSHIIASPFFWIFMLFPASVAQYVLAPVLALKMAFSSLFAYLYLRRFTKTADGALIGALLYAFSGYSLANSVFFHFHEAICFFPLLLLSLEEAVVNKRRGMFALCVALSALVNAFFFYGECVFLVIYFIVRMVNDKSFRITVGDFFCLAFESVAGVLLAGVMFMPSVIQLLGIDRVSSFINGTGMLAYSESQTYLVILKSLFLPNEPFSRPMLFTGQQTNWRSVTLYLPLFSVAGVVAYMRSSVKRGWLKVLVTVLAIAAFVPLFNSAFTMFNAEYYARWYYMAALILALVTVRALEEKTADWFAGCAVSLGGAVFFTLVYFFLPFSTETYNETYNTTEEHLSTPIARGWVRWEEVMLLAIALISVAVLIILLKKRHKMTHAKFMENTLSALVIVSIVIGVAHFFVGRLEGPVYKVYNHLMESKVKLDDDDEFFRINSDDIMNYNLCWGYSSPQSFITVLPSSITDIHTAIASENKRVIVSRSSQDIAFNALTRVKYITVSDVMQSGSPSEYYDANGFYKFKEKQGYVNVYESDAVVPMVCSYDTYCFVRDVTAANGDMGGENVSTNLMLHSVALDDETYEKYTDIMEREVLSEEELDAEQLKADIADRQALGAEGFEITKSGFTVKTSYDTDRIVVISTAYDKGWSAQINGKPVETDKANVGFLAVRVPAGENEVVFTYTAPGLKLGVVMTIAGAAAIAVYIAVMLLVLKQRPRKTAYPTQDRGVSLHDEYIVQLSENNEEN